MIQEVLAPLRALAGSLQTQQAYDLKTVYRTATFVGDEHAALAVMIQPVANTTHKEQDVALVTGLWFSHTLTVSSQQLPRFQEQLKVLLRPQQILNLLVL